MEQDLKRMAKLIATGGFFLLAGIGCASGVGPFLCGVRALAGAGILYVAARFAGGLIVNFVVGPLVRQNRRGGSGRRGGLGL